METIKNLIIPLYNEDPIRFTRLILAIIGCSLFVLWIFADSVLYDVKEKRKEKMRRKGIYFRELPISGIEIEFVSSYEDIGVPRRKRKRGKKNIIFLKYIIKKKREPDVKKIVPSQLENKKRIIEMTKDILSFISQNEICLFARSEGVYNHRNEDITTEDDEKNRSFCLDAYALWEKEKVNELVKTRNAVMNFNGQTVALYGISGAEIEKGYEIFVPNISAGKLYEMTLTELLRFCEPKNCKLQVRCRGCAYAFSDEEGYKKKDILKAIRSAAKKRGYKIKFKKGGR